MLGPRARNDFGRIVREIRHAVERRLRIREVDPVLVGGRRALQADAGREEPVEEKLLRGHAHSLGRVFQARDEGVEGDRRQQAVVFSRRPVGELDLALLLVHGNRALVVPDPVAPEKRQHAPSRGRASRRGAGIRTWRSAPSRSSSATRRLDGLAPVDDRHPLGDPVVAHLLQGCRPDLEVVRVHEVLRDAGAELRQDPFLEVPERPILVDRLGFDEADQALEHRPLGQRREVVLEGIADVLVLELDPALAVDPADSVLAEDLAEELVEVLVARKDDVARDVPGPPLRVGEARGEAADLARALEDLESILAALAQAVGRTEARRTGSEDDDPAAHCALPLLATRRRSRSAWCISARKSKR